MSFDALVANPGRLKILTALAVEERQEFVDLRRRTRLTDGNLAAHAKRLQAGGLVEIDKQFRSGKPVTSFALTVEGRRALESHARRLIAALSHRRVSPSAAVSGEAETEVTAAPQAEAMVDTPERREAVAAAAVAEEEDDDDWVD